MLDLSTLTVNFPEDPLDLVKDAWENRPPSVLKIRSNNLVNYIRHHLMDANGMYDANPGDHDLIRTGIDLRIKEIFLRKYGIKLVRYLELNHKYLFHIIYENNPPELKQTYIDINNISIKLRTYDQTILKIDRTPEHQRDVDKMRELQEKLGHV